MMCTQQMFSHTDTQMFRQCSHKCSHTHTHTRTHAQFSAQNKVVVSAGYLRPPSDTLTIQKKTISIFVNFARPLWATLHARTRTHTHTCTNTNAQNLRSPAPASWELSIIYLDQRQQQQVMSCQVMSGRVRSCRASCVVSYQVISRQVRSGHVKSSQVASSQVMSCPVVSCQPQIQKVNKRCSEISKMQNSHFDWIWNTFGHFWTL
jgi:hypothetical protein